MSVITTEAQRTGTRTLRAVLTMLLLAAAPAWAATPPASHMPVGSAAGGAPIVGRRAPLLLARTFSGEPIELAALRGKVVVLNFWASWCGPCRSEMPALDALSRDYRNRGVVVIGLSADDSHDRKDALAAASSVSYATGMLGEAVTNGFGAPQVLPMTYIVAADGTLAEVLTANRGALSAVQLRAAVDARLVATSPAP
jgi:thiol-disulfide isomerase/thioredoxin